MPDLISLPRKALIRGHPEVIEKTLFRPFGLEALDRLSPE